MKNRIFPSVVFLMILGAICQQCKKDKISEKQKWVKCSTGIPITKNGLSSIPIRLLNYNGFLYAGTTDNGVFFSQNSGASWTSYSTGLPQNSFISSFALTSSGKIYLSTPDNGVYYLSNEGNNWTDISLGLFKSGTQRHGFDAITEYNGKLYGSWKYTYNLSTNGPWAENTIDSGIGLLIDPFEAFVSEQKSLFAGGYRGIYRTDDAGIYWHFANKGLPAEVYVNALAKFRGKIYAGTMEHGLYRSQTAPDIEWTKVNLGIPKDAIILSIVSDGFSLIVGTDQHGIFLSSDGENWKAINEGLVIPMAWSLAITDSKIFAASSDGIYSYTFK